MIVTLPSSHSALIISSLPPLKINLGRVKEMSRSNRKRFWQIGCLSALFIVVGFMFGLFASTTQRPTTSIITQQTVLALHGPLRPDDEGVKAVWEELTEKWQREGKPAWWVLKWLGVPREVTLSFHSSQSPSGVFAVNFRKGYQWLWLLLRIFGKHYKGAHYVVQPQFVVGMHGGTVIVAEDEIVFCQAIGNFALAHKSEKAPLKLTRQFRDKYDFIGFINPQLLPSQERLPANLGEIGIDIVDANELRGSVFWVCQNEREAEEMMRALEQIEREMRADYSRLGVGCSFRKQKEGMFVWWEFRLTNFIALLF